MCFFHFIFIIFPLQNLFMAKPIGILALVDEETLFPKVGIYFMHCVCVCVCVCVC